MSAEPLKSGFLEGNIRHRRMGPVRHDFDYPMGMYAVRLDEWDRLDGLHPGISTTRPNRVWFRRRDYFQPGNGSLDGALRRHVEIATGNRPMGPIELITHPRYWGWIFNPVSFYFCYARDADAQSNPVPEAILAQITNTPWHERHSYVLSGGAITETGNGWRSRRYRFAKQFHVSPFNPMEQDYEWLFGFHPEALRVHMTVRGHEGRVFDATLATDRQPLTPEVVGRALQRFPAETLKASLGIHLNAFRLWRKGAVFHDHPQWEGASASNLEPALGVPANASSDQFGTVTSWKT
ncbi:DUF1365 domain-containing protein [Halovibrio salipaludis]|uniref:DUF1365 domain-containing protein n=1 Tax=Halovibrio salipaludis TaxID=2032626 RepID=A0A2A2F908_9GAMM|nr:DUF1365 domain-containing protein [Halovibrio salipaludis]PAU81147.1 DUF1365 domain-containing protein [Halovibrio salipaludis]